MIAGASRQKKRKKKITQKNNKQKRRMGKYSGLASRSRLILWLGRRHSKVTMDKGLVKHFFFFFHTWNQDCHDHILVIVNVIKGFGISCISWKPSGRGETKDRHSNPSRYLSALSYGIIIIIKSYGLTITPAFSFFVVVVTFWITKTCPTLTSKSYRRSMMLFSSLYPNHEWTNSCRYRSPPPNHTRIPYRVFRWLVHHHYPRSWML